MKLVILGGGGFRAPLVHEAVCGSDLIHEVVLHDSSPGRLDAVRRVVEESAAGREDTPRLRVTTDLREALTGADFVFAALRVGGSAGRIQDERVALDLGLLGQETIGPGGLAYALRTIPVMREVARTIADVAPNAWTINFTNPAGIITQTMREVLGDRVVGICDTPIGLVRRVSRLLGVSLEQDLDRVDYDYIGLNHLGWLRSVSIDGTDRLPQVLASDDQLEHVEEARLIGKDWVRATGCLPNEYLYYYLKTDEAIARIKDSEQTRGQFLHQQQDRFYAHADGCASPLALWRDVLHEREATYMAEAREADEERREEDVAGGGYQEVALRVMNALVTGRPERMILNVGNGTGRPNTPSGSGPEVAGHPSDDPVRRVGSGPAGRTRLAPGRRVVEGLPDDVVVEVACTVDGTGVHPLPVAPLGLGMLGQMARLRASEQAIADAAATGSRDRAWEGFSLHPLVDSPRLGRALLEGYSEAHPAIGELLRKP
ncbi:6-phospho-beta-glucosidase [Tessaracoccus rhinocerotis]|uniref:6-phospho-beta-glucosidase n=1 Tax=Tessaracoccus rhinocerotis TaxID=1689449 RepID=A0A553K0C8_9ACTN|nr:6-phospho-beta-glucosidase [Tessaracoccus rhinocerotis]TRY18161.1 6-phospho-beta-glucosidase [Tessaracoccus rhinocerotis]